MKKKKILSYIVLTILLLVIMLPVGAAEEDLENKLTPALLDKLETAGNSELIPVYIWMTDIDRGQIETDVYEETGYNMYNIEQDYEPISEKVMTLDSKSTEMKRLVADHEKLTASARLAEKVATETYAEAERRHTREAYTLLNTANVQRLGINNNRISFSSQYTPMVIATLTPSQIRSIAGSKTTDMIDLVVERQAVEQSLSSMAGTVKAHVIRDSLGYDGDGVTIGQIEVTTNSVHSINVRQIMESVAPNAFYEVRAVSNTTSFYSSVESLITAGCSIINCSFGFPENAQGKRTNWYTNEEKWIDHIEGPHGVSFVVAAGNYGHLSADVVSPGLAYNAITVGSINDNGTNSESDDTLQPYSSFANNGYLAVAKPDVMAPDTYTTGSSTSYSTALVSGVIAQMMEYKPMLKTRARLVKAALTASCDYKVSESVYSGLTAVEGGGVINAVNFYHIMRSNRYYSGSFTADEFVYTIELQRSTPRVGLAWARISSVGNGHTNPITATGTYVNLDLFLVVGKSELENSSVEQICIDRTATPTYKVKIVRRNEPGTTVWLALAWY